MTTTSKQRREDRGREDRGRGNRGREDRGFTLVELMIVIAIIGVLIGLLIPAISRVRDRAREAESKQFLAQLQSAIENYQQEFHAYPGPIADDMIGNPAFTGPLAIDIAATATPNFDRTWNSTKLTGSENLALGLLGGLKYVAGATPPIQYDPLQVGQGPASLNPASPKRYQASIDAVGLSWRDDMSVKTGRFIDAAGFADDTIVPEFVDKFPAPMPILYMRARRGVPVITTGLTATNNSVVTFSAVPPRLGTYDLSQIIGYTGAYTGTAAAPNLDNGAVPGNDARSIGESKRAPTYYQGTNVQGMANSNWYHGLRTVTPTASLDPGSNYVYPLDAYPYIQNPSMANTARNKDSYILISAGIDRIYGTKDDIVSFGSVGE